MADANIDRAEVVEAYVKGYKAKALLMLPDFLAQHPDEGFAWFMYGDCLREFGRTSEAEVAIRKCLPLAPPPKRWSSHVQLAYIRADQGSFDLAESHFRIAIGDSEARQKTWLWTQRGGNLAKYEKFEEALECHRRAIELDESNEEAYLNLGLVLRALQRYPEAMEAANQALKLMPAYPDAESLLHSLCGVVEP